MTLILVLLLLAGLALLATALTLPREGGRPRVAHIAYGAVVAILAATAAAFWSNANKLERASYQAAVILDGHYGKDAFVPVAMAFFDRYKPVLPEAYAHARHYCELQRCLEGESEAANPERYYEMQEARVMLRRMLEAIASSGKGHGHAH